jgi:two-component system alkaline phosphatase synthesis response regulator PhoP
MAKILIVEDEKPISELLRRNLTLVGHTCAQGFSGEDALRLAKTEVLDLMLLDLMLPGMSGMEVLRRLSIPAIILTARGDLSDRVQGLNLGADDYIVKPFETLELLARVTAVLRRTQKAETRFSLGGAEVDIAGRKVFLNGAEVELTPQEFLLLETFVVNKNLALSREKLLELAWGFDYFGDTRTVDVHVQRLRCKLGWEDRIKTVYKVGYRLEV